MRYELIEVDPATGEMDQVLSPKPGTMKQMEAERAEMLSEYEDDWDQFEQPWPNLMIRPAA